MLNILSDNPKFVAALRGIDRILEWMTETGRGRLIQWSDRDLGERVGVVLRLPLPDGTWATWQSGRDWFSQTRASIDGLVEFPPNTLDLSEELDRNSSEVPAGMRTWPRTYEGWLWEWDYNEWDNDHGRFVLQEAIPDFLSVPRPELDHVSSQTHLQESLRESCRVPDVNLRALMTLLCVPTYLGLTRFLNSLGEEWGSVECRWSPWAPPTTHINEDIPLLEGVDFQALAEFVDQAISLSPEGGHDAENLENFSAYIVEPLLIAYPGTPSWLLSTISVRCHQPELLRSCVLIPEESRAIAALRCESATDQNQEILTHPGTLLGPAASHAPDPISTAHPICEEVSSLHTRIGNIAEHMVESSSLQALRLIVNSPLWVMAVVLKDGWIGEPAHDEIEALRVNLDSLSSELARLEEPLSPPATDEELSQLHDSTRNAWLELIGVSTEYE